MVLSKPNWKFLAKRGTIAATPQTRLRECCRTGYPPGTDSNRQPYGQQIPNALLLHRWQAMVDWYTSSEYLAHLEQVSRDKSACSTAEFFNTMDRRNPVQVRNNAAVCTAKAAPVARAAPTEETENDAHAHQPHPSNWRPSEAKAHPVRKGHTDK